MPTSSTPEEQAARRERQRLERVFGDVLPETTRDERGPGYIEDRGTDARDTDERDPDAELRRNVPPHHG